MPSSVRPKGSTGGARNPPVTPMSERQQMALLMQMTSSSGEVGSRSPSSASRSRDRNERGETPLHLAAIKGDVEQVCRLLAHRADPNVADFAGWTPLHEACNHGWYEVALRLVQAGANVNAKGLDNDTPLHDASINGHLRLVKLLVEHGADIHSKNSKGKTPLDVAPAGVKPYLLNTNLPIPESNASARLPARSRDDKKTGESGKQKSSPDETGMDAIAKSAPPAAAGTGPTTAASAAAPDDVYEFKSVKDGDSSPECKSGADAMEVDAVATDALTVPAASTSSQSEESAKRGFAEMSDGGDESPAAPNDEESRRKKRKDETAKEGKSVAQRSAGQNKGQSSKQSTGNQSKTSTAISGKSGGEKKSPCPSPKPAGSDAELEDGKTDLKVPPLKIVIPQTSSTEQETGAGRNGKAAQRTHQALPYVVPSSNSSESSEKDAVLGTASPENSISIKGEEKKEGSISGTAEERASSHQRVLRSSHRSGTGAQGGDRGSNNSSPQLQRSHSPSPTASPASTASGVQPAAANQPDTSAGPSCGPAQASTASKSSDSQGQSSEAEASTSSTSSTVAPNPPAAPVELHPRKRKMKQSKESATAPQDQAEVPAEAQVHPHEQPITNCYQLFLNIRRQISKRRRGLFPVQPKPPQGSKDYLMNRCTYVLAGTAPTIPNITYPQSLPPQMKDLFAEQEKERYRMRTQHVIEKEKLVLSVEQEILRVHGRAARALANQSLPFSVCTILRDEEVYNLITPEQEEKDRNARSRYNGRLFLSWLQDVDDKWEKIKEHMLLRHHNEAESLHAVQKMDWEWKMKELSLCDRKLTPKIDDAHVPMVHVSDDFDLLPA